MIQLLVAGYVVHCLYATAKAAFGDPSEFKAFAERWRNPS
jgi:hypothetical protein